MTTELNGKGPINSPITPRPLFLLLDVVDEGCLMKNSMGWDLAVDPCTYMFLLNEFHLQWRMYVNMQDYLCSNG